MPERKFEEMSRSSSDVMFLIARGTVPVKKFVPMSKTDRLVSSPIDSESGPLSWLFEISNLFNRLKPRISEGTVPLKALLSKVTFSTTLSSESHSTPNHAPSISSLSFFVPHGLFADVQKLFDYQLSPSVEKNKVFRAYL